MVLVLVAVLGGLTALLLPVSAGRLIDGDEGYLLMAARLVSEGRVPYRDFFLPQGPLLPVFFGAFFWGAGRSWLGARLLAGAIAITMGLLVYRESLSATRRHGAAVFATALFAFSAASIGWLTIVKGYGLSALCILVSICLIGIVVRNPRTHHVASLAEVGEMIRRRNPRLFVEGNWATHPWATWLPQYGYQVRRTIHNVRLWTVE